MRVYVLSYHDPELPQDPIEWPLDTSLAGFGEAVPNAPSHTRCGVVTGEDLRRCSPRRRTRTSSPRGRAAGPRYPLIFRPLLPDEHAC